MEFKINFRAVEIAGSGIILEKSYDIRETYDLMPSRNVGIELLNRFNLKTEEVSKNHIKSMSNNIAVEISQSLAEESGRFTEESEIYVKISKSILQSFIDIDVFDGKQGKELQYIAREKDLLKFWIDNNFELLILSDTDKEKLKERQQERESIKAEKEAQEAEKAAREEERRSWILANGSDYLKDCLELGIKANREYVVERAALEFPGYTVDYTDNAKWEVKFSPSPEAISELKKVRKLGADAEIIWLTREAKERNEDEDEYDYEPFEPCEAVLVRKYLGKYDLVKTI
jgi:hypothetical protein